MYQILCFERFSKLKSAKYLRTVIGRVMGQRKLHDVVFFIKKYNIFIK